MKAPEQPGSSLPLTSDLGRHLTETRQVVVVVVVVEVLLLLGCYYLGLILRCCSPLLHLPASLQLAVESGVTTGRQQVR